MLEMEYSFQLGLFHACWCPGSCYHQVISRVCTDNARQTHFCLPWHWISAVCIISLPSLTILVLQPEYCGNVIHCPGSWFCQAISRHDIYCDMYRKTSNIRCTLVGNKIVHHLDVVGASPVGAAPNTSSFSTQHLASRDSAKTAVRQYENLFSIGMWCDLY